MKELLFVLSLVAAGTVAEPPAPYPPSGWRPSGPAFDLPQRASDQQPSQQYLPVDPRNPGPSTEADVSVQGLPQPEQRPLFQASPIAGRQFSGPGFNQDLRSLDKSFQQSQYQLQQERYREYQRQKQLESQANPTIPTTTTRTNRPPNNPRQFAQTESPTTDINLNQGEVLEPEKTTLKEEKTSVEVTKQDVKEFPGEFFLSSLAQLQLQPQFVRLETGQIQPFGAIQQQNPGQIQPSGAYIQPNQIQQSYIQGFDGPAHFSALPSVLAQAQKVSAQGTEQSQLGQVLVQQPLTQFAQAQVQTYQPLQPNLQVPAQFQPSVYQSNQEPVFIQPNSYQPVQANPDAVTIQPNSQYAPANYQPIQPVQPQFIAQPVAIQPQASPDTENIEQENKNQDTPNQNQFYQQPIVVPQFNQPGQFPQPGQSQFLQPQPDANQFVAQQNQFPQTQFQLQAQPEVQYLQPQYTEPQNQYGQPRFLQQPADIQNQYLQPQLTEPQNQYAQPQFSQRFGQQGQFNQPQTFGQPQGQFSQPQLLGQPQSQFGQPQQQFQGQDNLQSGFDVNQQGNDIEDTEDKDDEATAIATAFGSRTQPRVNTRYGAPFPVPKVQASPAYSTTESGVEEVTEGPVVAEAVAVADGGRRKSARLRSRRIRPVYAVDRSGRLVLAEA